MYLPSSSGKLYAYLFTDLKNSLLPVGAFIYSVNSWTVSFDASTSYGGVGDLTYSWDFGDGGTAEGAKVDHTFSSGGSHNVVLTVTDSNSASSDLTKTVILEASPNGQPGGSSDGSGQGNGGVLGIPIWTWGLVALAVIVTLNVFLRISRRKK
jgi:PKD repeat protein